MVSSGQQGDRPLKEGKPSSGVKREVADGPGTVVRAYGLERHAKECDLHL